jgi:hypothetical protein
MSLMSFVLSMGVLWRAFDAQTWFTVQSPRWLYHNFQHSNVIVIPRSLHARWSLKACSHQWHHCICFPTINKCWWFVLVFLHVVLVLWSLFVDGNLKGILIRTQIPIDNQTTSRIEFCNSNLSGVLAMDCLPEVVVNCSESFHQTYKSPLHIFCSLANGSLLPNIQLVLGILHQWTSFLSSQWQGTSLTLEEFNKPCLLSFSKWNKGIESRELVQKTHNASKQHVVTNNVCTKTH